MRFPAIAGRYAALFALLTFLLAAAPAVAAPGDELWSDVFAFPGANDGVQTSVELNGDLIVGGNFTEINSTPMVGVARWDGTTWHALGDGLGTGGNDCVFSLIVWNGQIYAGGEFAVSGLNTVRGVARWDGTAWQEVGGGIEYGVLALAEYGGELIVGGSMETVDPDGANLFVEGVASWNGTTWTDLQSGFYDADLGEVVDLQVYNGKLYAGGFFLSAGGGPASHVASYDGFGWQNVGDGVSYEEDPYSAYVKDLDVYNGKLVVAGTFDQTGDFMQRDGLAEWNGSSWEFSTPFVSGLAEVSAVGVANGQFYVVALDAYVYRRNGFSMEFLFNNSLQDAILHIGSYGTNVLFGGNFNTIDDVVTAGVALYDGTQISSMSSGQGLIGGQARHSVEWNGQLVVAGNFDGAAGATGSKGIAAWDGTKWTGFNGGVSSSVFHAVTAVETFEGDLIAGGSFTEIGGVAASRIARWNGTTWAPMGTGSVSTVTSLYNWNGVLYAHLDLMGNNGQIARWNPTGGTWDIVGADTFGGDAAWMLEYGGDLIVAGQFNGIDGQSVNHIVSYDGTTWSSLGGGVSGGQFTRIFGMTVHAGRLYITGDFTQAGSTPVNHLAAWDGASWSDVGGGLGTSGRALRSFDGDLFVTGYFTAVGGGALPVNNIARYDGTTWSTLGSGLDDGAVMLNTYGNRLFVGGTFTTAGTKPSLSIASWGDSGPTAAPLGGTRLAMLPAAPNPFGANTSISYELPRAAEVSIDVHDLRGRRVQSHRAGTLTAGRHSFTWNGRDQSGRSVANGTYFVILRAGGQVSRARVTVVR